MYRIWLKNSRYFDVDDEGRIIYDGERGMRFEPSDTWKIKGFARRHNAYPTVTLSDAAKGFDLGHGWVHDIDHGTQRMWASPSYMRAVRVEVLE